MGNSPGPKIRKKGAVGCSGPQNSKMEKKSPGLKFKNKKLQECPWWGNMEKSKMACFPRGRVCCQDEKTPGTPNPC